jgi:uncharacterized protein
LKHIIPISDFPSYLQGNNSIYYKDYKRLQSIIKLIQVNSRNFLIVIDKPLFFEISDEAYNVLSSINEGYKMDCDNESYPAVYNELDFYMKLGVFDPLPDVEEKNYVDNLCLLVAQACNLACEYCFAGGGDYSEKNKPIMDIDTIKIIIDKYFDHNSRNKSEIKIQFFGGEPLLSKDLIAKAIEYSEEKRKSYNFGVSYGLITNGTLIDNDIKKLMDNYNLMLRISLDGDKQVNDKFRRFKTSNKSVYETTIDNISKYSIDKNKIEIAMTYVDLNTNIVSSIKSLVNEGFRLFTINPLVKNDDLYANFESQEMIYESLVKQLKDVVDYVTESSKNGRVIHVEFIDKNMKQFYKPSRLGDIKKIKCSAGSRNLVINTKGEIYPCDLLLYDSNYKLGDITAEGIRTVDFYKQFNIEQLKKENCIDCKDCYMRFMCKGKCPYRTIENKEESYEKQYCSLIKYNQFLSFYFLTKITKKFDHPFLKKWNVYMEEDHA